MCICTLETLLWRRKAFAEKEKSFFGNDEFEVVDSCAPNVNFRKISVRNSI